MAAEEARGPVDALEEVFEGYSETEQPLLSYFAVIATFNAAFAAALLGARAAGRPLPRLGFGDLVLFGAATHKVSRLLAKNRVTAPIRAPFTKLEGRGGPAEVEEKPRGRGVRRVLGELALCPYCLDQWVAAGFAVTSVFAPQASRLAAGVFATVAVADFLQLGYKAVQEAI
jgi:hypothetical protein